ncbi:MAG: CDP-alcohol phosphatidyltransferase family protein, partial [Nitrospinota bacterium]
MAITTIPELNLATKITIFRILLVPVFVASLIYGWTLSAILIFSAAGASDSLDGIIARRRNESTRLGAILDPLAD